MTIVIIALLLRHQMGIFWSLVFWSFGAEKARNQQVELKDEGGAAGYMGGGADRRTERSPKNISSQGGIILKSESALS